MKNNLLYLFTSIIRQALIKKALLLNVINPRLGGVIRKGEKGTDKTISVRALAELLLNIEVVEDCIFGCHPYDKRLMCPKCC